MLLGYLHVCFPRAKMRKLLTKFLLNLSSNNLRYNLYFPHTKSYSKLIVQYILISYILPQTVMSLSFAVALYWSLHSLTYLTKVYVNALYCLAHLNVSLTCNIQSCSSSHLPCTSTHTFH